MEDVHVYDQAEEEDIECAEEDHMSLQMRGDKAFADRRLRDFRAHQNMLK